jgi:hypothetical protein
MSGVRENLNFGSGGDSKSEQVGHVVGGGGGGSKEAEAEGDDGLNHHHHDTQQGNENLPAPRITIRVDKKGGTGGEESEEEEGGAGGSIIGKLNYYGIERHEQ